MPTNVQDGGGVAFQFVHQSHCTGGRGSIRHRRRPCTLRAPAVYIDDVVPRANSDLSSVHTYMVSSHTRIRISTGRQDNMGTNQVVGGAELNFSALALGVCATGHFSEPHAVSASRRWVRLTTELVVYHVEERDAAGRAPYRDEGLALVNVAAPRRILKPSRTAK